jgi:hypothetical protein
MFTIDHFVRDVWMRRKNRTGGRKVVPCLCGGIGTAGASVLPISDRNSPGGTGFSSKRKSCPRARASSSKAREAGCPEKSRILHSGCCAFILIAKSIPEISGMVTSDMSSSGAFVRAAVNASSGLVKNLAEKPCNCKMAARVDAMTGSSSTTKIRAEVSRETRRPLPRIFS